MSALIPYAGAHERHFKVWSHGLKAKAAPKVTILSRMQTMFHEGMDTCDIADAFNMDEAEVYNRLAKARAGE